MTNPSTIIVSSGPNARRELVAPIHESLALAILSAIRKGAHRTAVAILTGPEYDGQIADYRRAARIQRAAIVAEHRAVRRVTGN